MRFCFYKKGFTLLELLVVLVVLSILTVSIRLSPQQNASSVKAEAELLLHQLRKIQQLAISGNKRTKIILSGMSYTLSDITYSKPILDSRTGQSTVSLPGGFSLSHSGLQNSIVVFDSQGTPYHQDFSNPLTSSAIISISDGNNIFQIEIKPHTDRKSVV